MLLNSLLLSGLMSLSPMLALTPGLAQTRTTRPEATTVTPKRLEIGKFDYPQSMLPVVIQLREAVTTKLQQTNRFELQGANNQDHKNPDSLPEEVKEKDFTLTGTVYDITSHQSTKVRFTDVLNNHSRPETFMVYTLTVDFRLVNNQNQNLDFAETLTESCEVQRNTRMTKNALAERLLSNLVTKLVKKMLSTKVASLEGEVEQVDGDALILGIGYQQGTREKTVFGVYDAAHHDPICYVRVTRLDRSSCRAEVGSIDFNRLANDRDHSYEKAFRSDKHLSSLVKAGMKIKSEN